MVTVLPSGVLRASAMDWAQRPGGTSSAQARRERNRELGMAQRNARAGTHAGPEFGCRVRASDNLPALSSPMSISLRLFSLSLALVLTCAACAQQNELRYEARPIGFYNVENLFDTLDGPNDDAEYLPGSAKLWDSGRYTRKLEHLARVISEMGTDILPDGLVA